MPYQRTPGGSYYVDLKPKGYHHRIVRSTGTPVEFRAIRMEAMLRDLAETGRHSLLDGLMEGLYTLPRLYQAVRLGDEFRLLDRTEDPFLNTVVQEFLETTDDASYRLAMERLLENTHRFTKASWLKNTTNLQRVIDTYAAKGLAPGTEARELPAFGKLIRRVFGEEERRKVMHSLDTRTPRNGRRVRYLTKEEIKALLASDIALGTNLYDMILVALSTGLRQGEQLALLRKDYVPINAMLTVEQGKSHSARRQIFVEGEAASILEDRSTLPPADARIFDEFTYDKLRYRWDKLRKHTGLTPRWHDLRHTFAVHCARAGVPMPELQKLLGHSNISTTMIYSQYAPQSTESFKKAMQGMGLKKGAKDGR